MSDKRRTSDKDEVRNYIVYIEGEIALAEERIESLQRELKSANTEAAHYERFAKQAEARVEELLSRPAITPEMRERIERALEIGPGNDPKFSERVFRDLLGEQDA